MTKMARLLRSCTLLLHNAPTNLYLLSFLLINTAVSLPYLTAPMIGEADAYVRSILAWRQWMTGNAFGMTFNDWPPLHTLFIQLSFSIYPNLYISPRVLTFLISSLGILFFFMYMRRYFNRGISLISTLLFTIFPLRLILGTQTLSEGLFLPFFLLTLTALSRPKLTKWYITITLVSSNIASGIRHEGWFLLPYIWLHFYTKIQSTKARIAALLLSFIVPIWMVVNSFVSTGDILAYFHHKVTIANTLNHPEYFNLYLSLEKTSSVLIEIIPIPLLILCGLGIYAICAPTKHTPPYIHHHFSSSLLRSTWLLLPIYYICLILLQVYTGTMEWIPQRYFVISATLLLPFFVIGILNGIEKNRALGIFVCLFLLALAPSYASAENSSLTNNAFDNLYIDKPVTALSDFRQLIFYLTSRPYTQVQYLQSADIDEETYSIATAYFLGQPQILTHRSLGDRYKKPLIEATTRTLIVEKPIPEYLIGLKKAEYENTHFAVFTPQETKNQE